jgi:hypothetical protein
LFEEDDLEHDVSELAHASEADLYAALGAATMALGTPDEVLALGALGRMGGVESLQDSGMAIAADTAVSISLEDRGRGAFGEFLEEFGERLRANVCADYKAYRDGQTDQETVVKVITAAIAALPALGLWAPLVALLTALLLRTGLDILCDLQSGTAPA